MTQTIYGLISDNGDGDNSVRWYRTQAEVDHVLHEPNGYDCYRHYWNKCVIADYLSFPAELDLEKCGFSFDTIEDSDERTN